MKCSDINKHIDEYIDQQLPTIVSQAVEQHITKCSSCARKIENAENLRSVLRHQMDVPAPSAGFEARAFAKVRQHYQKKTRSPCGFKFASGFSVAAVASLMVWIFSGTHLEQPQTIDLAMNQSKPLRLMIDSRSDISHAKLTIDIPDNVTLQGYPGRKELSWPTNISKGKNLLTLPFKVVNNGQGELRLELDYNHKVKKFRVVLKTSGNKV